MTDVLPSSHPRSVYSSPFPDVTIPDVSLAEFALRRARDLGDNPALIEGPTGRVITYRELADGVRRVAAGLHQRGFEQGDVFAIYTPNVPEFAFAYYAVASLGGIVTTVNPLFTANELATQLVDSGATLLLTVPALVDRAREAAASSKVREVFVTGESAYGTAFESLLRTEGAPPSVTISPTDDLVVMPYSSGTTGLPKGVMLTHRNLVANVVQTSAVEPIAEGERLLAVLPFFHIYGMTVILNMGLAQGATIVTMPRFDLEQFLQLLQDHRVRRAYLAPPIVLALAKHPAVDRYDLSALEVIMSGAAPLSGELAAACGQRIGALAKQGYGLTESSPVTHVNPDDRSKPGSIGPCVPNTEFKVVDPASGKDLGAGEQGELWIRGPQVMRGYLNQPAATAATVDAEGWLHTGDIGYADEEGYFFIVDRLKELIKHKGYQVAPAELEAVLVGHPAVADAAVIGYPDEEAGEVPKAFVVLKGEATADELMQFVAERVAPYKKIRLLELVDQIPKSPSGKILRRVLVERERERARTAAAS